MKVPRKSGDKITLTARLCYRKFAWWGTQFSFVGRPDPGADGSQVAPEYDDRKFLLNGSMHGVSAKTEKIPEVPIVALAQNQVSLDVMDTKSAATTPARQLNQQDWQRWNDYGIGLLCRVI